jgi:hypothetical protein
LPDNHEIPRKPLVDAVVILPILVLGGMSFMLFLISAFSGIFNIPASHLAGWNGLLISIPAFLPWIPVSLLLGNLLLCRIPPLRRIAERHVSDANRPGFMESQKTLCKALRISASVCLPLIILGFIL